MRALALVLLLLSSSVFAQVAGLCGPGKTCTVERVLAASRTAASPSFSFRNDSDTGFYNFSAGVLGVSVDGTAQMIWRGSGFLSSPALNSNLIITESTSSLGTGTQGITCNATYCTSLGGLGTGTVGAGTAFGSFPTAASLTGRLLYDSTNNAWRYSTGVIWSAVGESTNSVVCYFPGLAALLSVAMCQWRGASPALSIPANISETSATTLVAGTGAGNATFTVHNITDAAPTAATVTVACASAAGTVTAGSTDATTRLNKQYQWRLTTNGCTTLPQVNLQASNGMQF